MWRYFHIYISCDYCFDRYFSLTLESTAIPQKLINHLLFDADPLELKNGIQKINHEKKTTRLLEHIYAIFDPKKMNQGFEERASIVLRSLLLCWENLDNNANTSFFAPSLETYLLVAVKNLLTIIIPAARYPLLDSMFNINKVSITTIYEVLRELETQHNRFINREDYAEEKLLTLDEVIQLEGIFTTRTIAEFESGEILNHKYIGNVLWLFEQLEPEKLKSYLDNIVVSDLSLAKFIGSIIGHGKIMSRTISETRIVHTDEINKYIDISTAYSRVSNFVNTDDFFDLPLEKKKCIAAFLARMEYSDDNKLSGDGIPIGAVEKKLSELEKSRSLT